MGIQVDGYTVELIGRAGDVGARFERLPYRLKDGKQRFAHDDFGSELIDALYRVLPPEPKRFLLLGAAKCRRCGTRLPEQPRPHPFDLRIDIKGLEPINMTVELPSIQCPSCGTDHRIDNANVEADLSDAMIAAFESGGLGY